MNTEIQTEEIYRSTDLALAAAIFMFYPLEGIDKENPRKASFLFRRSKELDQFIDSYWKGELKVSPQEYFNALRLIKARLYGN